MSIVVNTNIASMNAQRSLHSSGIDLREAMERLSTGKKINSAADDAAGFAIAESMTAQIRGLGMAAKNANDALGMLKVVENATNDITDMLQRIRELTVQAASDTNKIRDGKDNDDIDKLNKEARELLKEIDRVSSQTSYNDKKLLSGNFRLQIQVGYNDDEAITVETWSVESSEIGLGNFHVRNTENALEKVSAAIDKVAGYKAKWGAGQNRLEYTVANLMNVVEFTSSARSRIQDADFAVEAAKLAKAQVLQQTGAAMLAQANAAPQLALQLIK
jgi:flagellin